MTALAEHVQHTWLCDTHEHLRTERVYLEQGPDVLVDLFGNYVSADLISAGASQEAVAALLDSSNADVEQRWLGVREAWQHCRFTGYGEAVRGVAREVYAMDEITLAGIEAAADLNLRLRRPGERLRILRERGRLDHVQIDDSQWACAPDESGPGFFLYDLSLVAFVAGRFDPQALALETGIEVRDLASLDTAMSALFAKYGPLAVAVKTQHAYERTLRWRSRSREEVAPVLTKHLRGAGAGRGGAQLSGRLVPGARRGAGGGAQSAAQDPYRLLRRQQSHAGGLHPPRQSLRAAGSASGHALRADAQRLAL